MDILVVGGGGREHAIIRKLKQSSKIGKLYCAPGNGGISQDAECFNVPANDIDGMVALAESLCVDMVFVAPDDPLVAGMVDALESKGIKAFGPDSKAAILEGSKAFSKNLMKKYGIPTANYEVFDDPGHALSYINKQNTYPTVIKADGLALGKGVVICENMQDAKDAITSIMEDKVFGESGCRVVVEEFLTGPEVSVLAFTDGITVIPMVSAMDHKRAFDGNMGPNTGGMGTISPNPYYDEKAADYCMTHIFQPTVDAMRQEGRPFKGCLFFGLMITPDGPKVIEYNCRFGDPETQVVLPRLKTDLIDIITAVRNETLHELTLEWDERACACVVMASGGYPAAYRKGLTITGLDKSGQYPDTTIYHAGTLYNKDKFITNGGRVIGVTAMGFTLDEALDAVYDAIADIKFEDVHFRKDIGRS